jgi:RNA polymerase sigma-70 factor, ECF subfamily
LASYHITNAQLAEEQNWIAAAQKDPRAFGKIYEFYYKRIFLFIFKRVENEETAADVCSQVFLKAMTNIQKFSFQGVPFSAWLYRIALNEVNMHFRQNKGQPTESVEMSQLAEMIDEADENYSDETIKQLMEVLKKLPSEDMQLVSLRFFEQLSFKEVADIVGITENNAKVRVYRILEKLKKQFKPME